MGDLKLWLSGDGAFHWVAGTDLQIHRTGGQFRGFFMHGSSRPVRRAPVRYFLDQGASVGVKHVWGREWLERHDLDGRRRCWKTRTELLQLLCALHAADPIPSSWRWPHRPAPVTKIQDGLLRADGWGFLLMHEPDRNRWVIQHGKPVAATRTLHAARMMIPNDLRYDPEGLTATDCLKP